MNHFTAPKPAINLGEESHNYVHSQIVIAAILFVIMFALTEPLTMTVTLVCGLVIVSRLFMLMRNHLKLTILASTTVKNVGAIVMTSIIVASAQHSGLINSMVNLLVSGATLWWFTLPIKLEPLPKKRLTPVFKLCLCLFFLISVGFIYEQTLAFSLLFFTLILVTWFALFLCESSTFTTGQAFRFVFNYFAACLPVAAFLFLLMPNLSPFWQLPKQQQATSGLSEKMTPGDIADLANSKRLAFRAAFEGGNPAHENLYWRVMTMSKFDGKTWLADNDLAPQYSASARLLTQQNVGSDALSYSIIGEPTHTKWLYALSGSRTLDRNILHYPNDTLGFNIKQTAKIKYQATKYLPPIPPAVSIADFNVSSEPAVLNQRQQISLTNLVSEHPLTLKLTNRLMQKAKRTSNNSLEQTNIFIGEILSLFRNNAFIYTLTPTQLTGNHIDQFLFDTRQGFCAHYASATTVMLRQQGIPARVVAGYQGGEYNPTGNYFNVYDSAAHAWIEYWIADHVGSNQGNWYRVDPTAAIAPNRILRGLGGSEVLNNDVNTAPIEYVKSVPWLNNIRQKIQSLDYYWTIWVLDFDPTRKENRFASWFKKLSLIHLMTIILTLTILMLAIGFWATRTKHNRQDVSYLLYLLENKLVSIKTNRRRLTTPTYTREPHQTVKEYEIELIDQFPDLSVQLSDFFSQLDSYLYDPTMTNNKALWLQLKACIKQLH